MEDPANYGRVHERIKKLWEEGLYVPHAQDRMRKRKVEDTDVQYLIKTGRIVEHHKPGDFWRYRLEGTSVDGKKVACVVEINDALKVITVMRPRR